MKQIYVHVELTTEHNASDADVHSINNYQINECQARGRASTYMTFLNFHNDPGEETEARGEVDFSRLISSKWKSGVECICLVPTTTMS